MPQLQPARRPSDRLGGCGCLFGRHTFCFDCRRRLFGRNALGLDCCVGCCFGRGHCFGGETVGFSLLGHQSLCLSLLGRESLGFGLLGGDAVRLGLLGRESLGFGLFERESLGFGLLGGDAVGFGFFGS